MTGGYGSTFEGKLHRHSNAYDKPPRYGVAPRNKISSKLKKDKLQEEPIQPKEIVRNLDQVLLRIEEGFHQTAPFSLENPDTRAFRQITSDSNHIY